MQTLNQYLLDKIVQIAQQAGKSFFESIYHGTVKTAHARCARNFGRKLRYCL